MRRQTMRKLEDIPMVAASERRFETAFSDDSPTLRRTSRFRAHDDEEEATVKHSMRPHSIATE
jgi:hypothetical protein